MNAGDTPGQVSIRLVRPDDKQRIVAAFHALSRESVYLRFFSYRKELSEQELRRVTESDGVSEVVLVATVAKGAEERIVGVGSYVRHGAVAEVAFAVADDFRCRGIATQFLARLAELARRNGITGLEADVLAENTPMLEVLRHSGMPMRARNDHGVVHATLSLESDRKSTVS